MPLAEGLLKDNQASGKTVAALLLATDRTPESLEALKQAGHYARPAVLEGAPHFWIGDPLEEEGGHSAFFAHRLLRFLQAKV